MKLIAVSLSVILLAGMFSCVTKDKSETNIPDANKVAAMQLKKETAAQLPIARQNTSIKAASPEVENVQLKTSLCEGFIDGDVIPPPAEEDSIGVKEDNSNVFLTCNLESEAEYSGGTNAWLHYLHSNIRMPRTLLIAK